MKKVQQESAESTPENAERMVFSVAPTGKRRYFWGVWRSEDEIRARVLDVADPIASGERSTAAEAVAAALEVAPGAERIANICAGRYSSCAKWRDEARRFATRNNFVSKIEADRTLLEIARSRDERRLMQAYNLRADTIFGGHEMMLAFEYAIRVLHGREAADDLERFAFVDAMVDEVLRRGVVSDRADSARSRRRNST